MDIFDYEPHPRTLPAAPRHYTTWAEWVISLRFVDAAQNSELAVWQLCVDSPMSEEQITWGCQLRHKLMRPADGYGFAWLARP